MDKRQERERRLAEALRENLRRRKQARQRAEPDVKEAAKEGDSPAVAVAPDSEEGCP